MSDRLAVFNLGRVEQIGTPEEIYEQPATAFVAGFVGASNIVDAEAALRLVGTRQAFSLRPERIRIGPEDGQIDGEHGAAGTVASIQYHGASTRIEVALEGSAHADGRPAERPARRGAARSPARACRLAWSSAAMQPLHGDPS